MTTTRFRMTQRDDTSVFIIEHTSPNDLVWAIFEQVWFISEKLCHLGQKFLPILLGPMSQKITY
ncbi:hypothetical protein Q0M10_13875, partial [Staphylococcus aureus]|nr:hypothetical protein [Staphylococcus aureus]